ncbi:alpha-amylase family glycosyl hydrolase [Tunturiibacter gelidiferens]
MSKLDYLQDLGVTCLWLLPFFPSPLRDDGYDIANYVDVNPSYGTLNDFKQFLDAAHLRGMQVMIELVINHTSDQHPWFKAARLAPKGSPSAICTSGATRTSSSRGSESSSPTQKSRTGPGTMSRSSTTGTASSLINQT